MNGPDGTCRVPEMVSEPNSPGISPAPIADRPPVAVTTAAAPISVTPPALPADPASRSPRREALLSRRWCHRLIVVVPAVPGETAADARAVLTALRGRRAAADRGRAGVSAVAAADSRAVLATVRGGGVAADRGRSATAEVATADTRAVLATVRGGGAAADRDRTPVSGEAAADSRSAVAAGRR